MKDTKITDTIKYIGVDDKTLDLFESQYLIPNGISYNSYVIHDNRIVVMDTVDKRKTDEWMDNLINELGSKKVDYLVISHLEPDHSSNIKLLADKFPNMKLVGNKRTFDMLPRFFDIDLSDRQVIVNEGDTLDIGKHKLQFFMAPMVHWPEVMVTYEKTEKVLFSADGFGKFGALDTKEDWDCEARRYYFNIVGKYGDQVQQLLKKAMNLDIKIICPLHGPILKEKLEYYINKYDIWSSYKPENKGIFIAYASIHGNTKNAIEKFADILKNNGEEKIIVTDLARCDMAEAVEDAFRYDRLIIASPTYDAGLFPCVEDFLRHLKHKNYQNRKVGIIENGSWAPVASKCIKEILDEMKGITTYNTVVSIKTKLDSSSIEKMKELAKEVKE